MSVGDVNSTARGSGARYNDGKPELAQIPLIYWYYRCQNQNVTAPGWVQGAIGQLSKYQETGNTDYLSLVKHLPSEALREATYVFSYGAHKYAQWNWTKGMAWSIPINCILRHLDAFLSGETLDPESGQPHTGHIACNLVMIDWFVQHYPEGEDWVKFDDITE